MNAHPEVVMWPQSEGVVTPLIFNNLIIQSQLLHLLHVLSFMPKHFSYFQNEKLIVMAQEEEI